MTITETILEEISVPEPFIKTNIQLDEGGWESEEIEFLRTAQETGANSMLNFATSLKFNPTCLPLSINLMDLCYN